MLDERNVNVCNVFQDLNKGIGPIDIKKDIINTSSSLILALEDMIESLENTKDDNKKGGFAGIYKSNKAVSLNDIKGKSIRIKNLFNDLQLKFKSDYIKGLEEKDIGIKNFQLQVEHYMDETLTDWLLISESGRVIDCTHDICYKVRELLRKLERNDM